MNSVELLRFDGPTALAEAAAVRWLDLLAGRAEEVSPHCVAVSGGRIARGFFRAVAEQARARGRRLEEAHFFWADERCVPPDHPESNFGLARDVLLSPLGIAVSRVHRILGEAEPDFAASQAEADLRRLARINDDGVPVLDLILLGMGEDGHVASLFPGGPEVPEKSSAIYQCVRAPKAPPLRITLSYAAIAAAREVWVLASGRAKEQALAESLALDGRTPLARVLRGRRGTVLLTDVGLA